MKELTPEERQMFKQKSAEVERTSIPARGGERDKERIAGIAVCWLIAITAFAAIVSRAMFGGRIGI